MVPMSRYLTTHRTCPDSPRALQVLRNPASLLGLEDSHSCFLGFRTASSWLLLQPLSLCHLLVLCIKALTMSHLLRQKGVKGKRKPRAPGLQWQDSLGGNEVQANTHHLPPALCSPFYSWKQSGYEVKHLFCFEKTSFVFSLSPQF